MKKLEYKNWDIEAEGFKRSSTCYIVKIIITKDKQYHCFAFGVDHISIIAKKLDMTDLLKQAVEVVKNAIDFDSTFKQQEYTYEFDGLDFVLEKNPKWWIFQKPRELN